MRGMNDQTQTTGGPTDSDPYAPYPAGEPERRWHVIFGVLCLLYGGIGLVTFGCVTIFVVMGPLLSEWIGRDVATHPDTYWLTLSQSIALVGLASLLIVGAVRLLYKDPIGYRLMLAWSAARLCFALIQLVIAFMTIDTTVRVQMESYEKMMESFSESERSEREAAMRSWGVEPPTYESARAAAPRWIGIMTAPFAVWPIVVGIALTGRRCRDDVVSWRTSKEYSADFAALEQRRRE
jgi:hypothetical protein